MAWLAIDKIGRETISDEKPIFDTREWSDDRVVYNEGEEFWFTTTIILPTGTIRKILGTELTFEDSPIEIK